MAYNEEKITGIGALKSLAQRLRAETPKNVSDLANDAKYQTEEQVATAMAAAEHLQRKKVTSVEEIDPTAEGADKFIYMVPKASSKDGDKYDEYMVLDGEPERLSAQGGGQGPLHQRLHQRGQSQTGEHGDGYRRRGDGDAE